MRADDWVSAAAKVAQNVLRRDALEVDRDSRWPAASLSTLSEARMMGLTVPDSVGGGGQGAATFVRVVDLLAQHCASTAMIYVMHVCATQLILAAREFSERESVLRSIAAGRHLTTLAFSERGSRSHFWAPISQAAVDGEGVRVSAEKSWVTSAGHADSYVICTRSAGRSEPLASTLYYVPSGEDGLSVSGPWQGMGLRGNASAPMRLETVRLSNQNRLSTEGEGFSSMMQMLPWFQLGSSAVSLGIARSAADQTRHHLSHARLEHLGQSLADLPTLRARLAQMRIAIDALAAFVDRVAGQVESPGPDTLLGVLECKALAAETVLHVTDLAMRACGGAAFSAHLAIERNFRDARAGAVMAPTTDVLHDLIAKTLLDLPLF
jgi:alkylation response protein AidB-like acyl-CoA dehydrogenase